MSEFVCIKSDIELKQPEYNDIMDSYTARPNYFIGDDIAKYIILFRRDSFYEWQRYTDKIPLFIIDCIIPEGAEIINLKTGYLCPKVILGESHPITEMYFQNINFAKRAYECDKRWLKYIPDEIQNIFEKDLYLDSSNYSLPKLPFERLVREISQDYKDNIHYNPEAINLLQRYSEEYLIKLFKNKSNTLSIEDINYQKTTKKSYFNEYILNAYINQACKKDKTPTNYIEELGYLRGKVQDKIRILSSQGYKNNYDKYILSKALTVGDETMVIKRKELNDIINQTDNIMTLKKILRKLG